METFDLQFRDLYFMSRSVSLNKVPLVDEPAPEPVPQVAPAPVSVAVARKLINPKYALVATGTHTSPSSSDQNSSNKNSNPQNPAGLKIMKGRLKEVIEEPPIHPGLAHLERAYLIPYLPTWPDPDPPSDVIGFINIRDEKRAHQVHLQRSERFEVSQAIRFSSPLSLPAQTEEPVVGQNTEAAGAAEPPPGRTNPQVSAPDSQTNREPKEQQAVARNPSGSRDPPEQPNSPPTQDTHHPTAEAPTSRTTSAAEPEPMDNPDKPPETQAVAPPVPKRRTVHLVIDPVPLAQPDQPQVTLVKMDQMGSIDGSSSKKTTKEEPRPARRRLTSKNDGRDSGSNDNGSLDSTKVMCDRQATDHPSSASTASEEEFYECPQQQLRDPLSNGVTTGSGRGPRQGDGVNMMARLSQSMLDLREPGKGQDSAALIRESQQLRGNANPSPHRHIGQVSSQKE